MPKSRLFYLANKSFYAIRENKILAKIFEFTVYGKIHQNEKGKYHLN